MRLFNYWYLVNLYETGYYCRSKDLCSSGNRIHALRKGTFSGKLAYNVGCQTGPASQYNVRYKLSGDPTTYPRDGALLKRPNER